MASFAQPTPVPAPPDVRGDLPEARVNVRAELHPDCIRLAQSGDRGAQVRFVRFYETRVFAFLSRTLGHSVEVQDLAQEVFLRALRALPRFTLNAKVSSWILSIAVRLLIDRHRKTSRQKEELAQLELPEPSRPDSELEARETWSRVEQALRKLSPELRVCFLLHYAEDLDLRELSQVLDIPVATAKTRLFRARQFVSSELKMQGLVPLETKHGEAP